MSVFKGNILEYPGVIVDRFNASNCRRGRVFFLSHCHKDHMSGLDSDDLLKALRERKINFYCSEITLALLGNDPEFSHLIPYLSSLPIQETINLQLIPFREEDSLITITVTLLPAGHCPGSVMFLFQGESGNVLYTGDFRLSVDELKRCSHLHNEVTGNVLDISTLYLDTTFCHPRSMNIITRDETRDIIVKKTKEWLAQSSENVVHLDCRSFGYEHIYLSLFNQLNTKIHIDNWKMSSYSVLPSVKECLTQDGNSTRIHACSYKKGHYTSGLPCHRNNEVTTEQYVLRIKPSTQWFVTSGWNQPYKLMTEMNLLRVMHSMHASYSELKDFVSYLSPASIIPCVIPATLGDTSLLDLHGRLRSFLPTAVTISSILDGHNHSQVVKKRKLINDRKRPEYKKQKKAWSLKKKAEAIQIKNESFKEEELEVESNYETDDEILSDTSPCISPASSDHSSITFNLPALSSSSINKHKIVRPCIQPVVSLSFDFEETPSPVTKKLKTDNKTTPIFIDLTQSSDNTSSNNDSNHYSNSKSPSSVIIINDNSSSDYHLSLSDSSHSDTPLKDTPLKYTVTPLNDIKDMPSHDTPLSSYDVDSRSRSPSVIPLTPLKEDSESVLLKRNFVFM